MSGELKSFDCCVVIDAAVMATIKAPSADEAASRAQERFGHVTLCHHCSSTLSVGDALGVIVNVGDQEVLDTRLEAETIQSLTRQRDALLNALQTLLPHIPEPPAPNCTCHRHAPCADCVENQGLREDLQAARGAVQAASPKKAIAA